MGAEIGVDPVILNLLVGQTVKGVDKHYLAKLRISVLRASVPRCLGASAQRIADEIDNPRELTTGDGAVEVAESPGQAISLESVESYLPSTEDLAPRRHARYLKREDLHKLVWTAPVSEIASQMGISDVGLAKACRRADTPHQVEAIGPKSMPGVTSEWIHFFLHRPGSQSSSGSRAFDPLQPFRQRAGTAPRNNT